MKNKVITNGEMFDSFRKKCEDIDKHITDYRSYSEEFKNEDDDYYQIVIWLDNGEKIYYLKRKDTIHILTAKEKEYLESVIRPFKDRVKSIWELESNDEDYAFISIDLIGEVLYLPYFKKDTMYKGMEFDKPYSLKELGLFEGIEK